MIHNMGLRTEQVTIGEKTITMHEVSFAGNLRLSKKKTEEFSFEDLYREMMSPEDFAYLEQVGKSDFQKVREAFKRLQGGDAEDFPENAATNGK